MTCDVVALYVRKLIRMHQNPPKLVVETVRFSRGGFWVPAVYRGLRRPEGAHRPGLPRLNFAMVL